MKDKDVRVIVIISMMVLVLCNANVIVQHREPKKIRAVFLVTQQQYRVIAP